MDCLVVAATSLEIKPFLEYLHKQEGKDKHNRQPDVLITGIGLTAATYSLTKRFHIKKPDLVIQAGVAGCFNNNIPLGHVLSVSRDTIADQSVIEINELKTLFDLKLVPNYKYPFKKGWMVNPHTGLLKTIKLKSVRGISVNEITTSRQKIKFYQQAFRPLVESMEGSALHYCCLMEHIPFVQIRSISNYIGERNRNKWNMKEAIGNLNHELIRLLENL